MRRSTPVYALALLLAALPAAAASRPEAEQKKIDWLLTEVKGSPATFIRNGAEHPADKAASHLKRKLMFAGSRVQTARQFVVGVASHSEETQKPYEMRFPDGTVRPLGEWLMERLSGYETKHGESPANANGSVKTPAR